MMIAEVRRNPCRPDEANDEADSRVEAGRGHRQRIGWRYGSAPTRGCWGCSRWRWRPASLRPRICRPPRRESGRNPSGAVSLRRVPDALKFAHGLLRQRKFDLAAEEYDNFLDTGPKGPTGSTGALRAGQCRLYQGRYKEARRAFEIFLKEEPGDYRARTARYRLGELSYLTGDLPAARVPSRRSRPKADHPGMETAWTYLGDVCFALNDLAGARAAYERSLSAFPRGRMADRARYGLGRTLAGLGERDRALRVLRDLSQQGASEWVDRDWLQIGSIQQSAGGSRRSSRRCPPWSARPRECAETRSLAATRPGPRPAGPGGKPRRCSRNWSPIRAEPLAVIRRAGTGDDRAGAEPPGGGDRRSSTRPKA